MARANIVFRSVVAGIALAAALFVVLAAPGGDRPERPRARDVVRTSRPQTPAEFFKQDVVRFKRVRVDMNGLIYADGQSRHASGRFPSGFAPLHLKEFPLATSPSQGEELQPEHGKSLTG
jgi:hypothetical protein